MADMICVEDMPARVAALETAGIDFIGVHVGVDSRAAGFTQLQALAEMKACAKRSMISVAGGISLQTIEDYKRLAPDVVIVGGGINHAPDPARAAKLLYESIHTN